MDPQGDNSYLNIGDFVRVGKEWLSHVRQAQSDEMDNRSVPFPASSTISTYVEVVGSLLFNFKLARFVTKHNFPLSRSNMSF
jgi:hypothetical protein